MKEVVEGFQPACTLAASESRKKKDVMFYVSKININGIKYQVSDSEQDEYLQRYQDGLIYVEPKEKK